MTDSNCRKQAQNMPSWPLNESPVKYAAESHAFPAAAQVLAHGLILSAPFLYRLGRTSYALVV